MISEGDLDLVGACQGEVRDLKRVESFGHHSSLILYEGKPSQSIGHYTPKSVEGGTSYFDRLWRTGAGKHAEMMKRYIICLKTRGGNQEASSNERASAEEDVTRQTEEGKGPGKKRCADKQRRRNERRLLKKHQLGNR
jgi:hypothetical protein